MGRSGQGGLEPLVSRLAAAWADEHPRTRHRRLGGTLVSADLSGFTALSERLAELGKRGAEELTALVNSCFTVLIDEAVAEGGDVVKFGGDALLVWFGAHEDEAHARAHPERAVRAAARMQAALGAARFARLGLQMSVGAHSADFDLFLVGRPEWRELVLAGPDVSRTVELESAAAAGQVLVSAATAVSLPGAWTSAGPGGGAVVDLDSIPAGRRRAGDRRNAATGPAPGTAARLVAPRLQADVAALADTGGEHRMATVVFAELEGTDATVASDPRRFASSVDALVRATQEAAARYGLLFLYTDVIADGIKLIAVAGAPVSTGEDEEAALRFAHQLVAGDPLQKLKAGVNRGRVFAGFLGSPRRRTYTVMGDPVNLAARLMARAEPGQVLASDEVIERSRAEFVVTPVAPFLVKGKARPVSAQLVQAPTGAHRTRAANDAPIVGREEERAQLAEAIEAASSGAGQVVEIVGDAGVGKTRLIEAMLDDPRILVRVTTECQPYDGLTPFAGLRPLLRAAFGISPEAGPGEAGHVVRRLAERVAPEVVPLLPLVAVPVGAEVEDTPEAAAIAEEFRQQRMVDSVVGLLRAALPTATVLVVEDVYYIDDASLQLLRGIAAVVPAQPWVLAVTRRPEGPGLLVGPVDGTLVKLQPLPDAAALQLAERALGLRSMSTADLLAIAARSGGNPLFVLELVAAAESGVDTADLPESIERLVAARIDRLAPEDRALLRRAAVVGRVFHTSIVNTLLVAEGRSMVDPRQWERLGEFVEVERERRWRFRHALFRDVAYEGLPFARRRRMHEAVGELLEAGVAGLPDNALLSLHFWLAGDAARTWRYSVAAGDEAWRSFAVTEAIAAYRRALGVRRRLRHLDPAEVSAVAESLGDVLERAAQYDEAEQVYRLARRSRSSGPDRARLVRKLGTLHERRGRYASALRCYGAARRELQADDEATVREGAELRLAEAGVRHRQGRHGLLVRAASEAVAAGEAIEDARLIAHGEMLLQLGASHIPGEGGSAHGERARALFTELGDVLFEGKVLNNLGVEAYFRGAWAEADRLYREAERCFVAAGDFVEAAGSLNNLGEIRSDQGRYDEARELFERALGIYRNAGYPLGVGYAQSNLGRCLARAGDPESGRPLITSALELFEGRGISALELEAHARLAEAALLSGQTRSARERCVMALDRAAHEEVLATTKASLLRFAGWAALQSADLAAAQSLFLRALRVADDDRSRFEIAMALDALTVVGRLLDDPHGQAYEAEAERDAAQLGLDVVLRFPLPL